MSASRHAELPRPGPVWGRYPQRRESGAASKAAKASPRGGRIPGSDGESSTYRALAARVQTLARDWLAEDTSRWAELRRPLAARLAREGLHGPTIAQALGCVVAHAERFCGLRCFHTQILCAIALLDQRLVEMATGEGKTLAAATAAAAAALGGVPVHVITANDYLAERDAQQLRPLFESLGLTVSAVTDRQATGAMREPSGSSTASDMANSMGYRADIVYATARTIAFDHLRDRLRCPVLDDELGLRLHEAAAGSGLRLRGLCMAIIDEIDSILIDEAQMPLVLSQSRADPDERAHLWLALDRARQLDPATDFVLLPGGRSASLTATGEAALLAAETGQPPFGLNRGHRRELVEQALVALHGMKRDVHYMLCDGEVLIVDAVTGRSAPGRVWSRGLHGLVALKEGLSPPMRTDTIARTTFPLFFRRYHHLSGLSGTLREVAGELARDYGLRLFTVPLRTPSRRRILPPRVFQTRADLFEAALARALSLVREHGRPVLLTTDSITDTGWFAGRLEASGVVHAILNAATADEEARIVSEAAQAPCVTVATQMAGRGTDVSLSDAVRQAGGLHVLNLQHNRSRRVDRQIAGRAARRGDPGSCEHWQCLEVGLGRAAVAGQDRQPDRRSSLVGGRLRVGRWFGGPWMITMAQRLSEREDASLRRALGRTERRLADGLLFAPKSD